MPFGPGTYPPGDPRNEGVDSMMGGGMAPPVVPGMGGGMPMDTQNPLIMAILQLLMSQGQGGGMIPGMIPGANPPGMEMAGSPTLPAAPMAPAGSPLLDLLRGQESGGSY